MSTKEWSTVIWAEGDDRFRVVVGHRSDRPGYRVRSGYRGGHRDTRSTPDREEALAIGRAIWDYYQAGALTAPTVAPQTVAQLGECIERRDDVTIATKRGYAQVWAQLTRAVGEERSIHRVHASDLEAWLSAWEGVTRATYLRTVRAIYRWAIREGWASKDPTIGVEVRAPRARVGSWLPWDMWPHYLSHCAPAHRIRSGIALETGMRAGEILHARPEWVVRGLGRPSIRIAEDPATGFRPKWGSARAIPLTDMAIRFLEDAAEMWPGSRFLFAAHRLTAPNLARETRAACEAAQIKPRVTFHGLRRSAGAHWLDAGMGLLEVSRLLGHQSIETTQRWYAGVAESTLTRAIEAVQKRRAR